MELPFTREDTETVRARYGARIAKKNLDAALAQVALEVEAIVLFTNDTWVNIDFKHLCRKHRVDGEKTGLPDGSTPMLTTPSVREELIARIRAGFPTSTIEMTDDTLRIDWSSTP